MRLQEVSRQKVIEITKQQLGLDDSFELMSTEYLASAIRYTASVVCPTSPRNLVSAVTGSMKSIAPNENIRDQCRAVLDALISNGDLIESEEIASESGNRLLYLAPPYYVRLANNQALLLGVAPDGVGPHSEALAILLRGTHRIIDCLNDPAVAQAIKLAGLEEMPYKTWAKSPAHLSFRDVVREHDRRLDKEPRCGDIDGLNILRWDTPTHWYRKRWGSPDSLTGRFVGRRPRRYGADLWCYIELENGVPLRASDLPVGRTNDRGCDQAWRLQCAIDAMHESPQQYRVTKMENDQVRIAIHIPPPSWLSRRWDCIGTRVPDNVFAFDFGGGEARQETRLLEEELWMVPYRD